MTNEMLNLLYQRCFAGDLSAIRGIIEHDDIDPAAENGQALVYVIRGVADNQQKKEILKYFKGVGVDLNMTNKLALEWSIIVQDLELVHFLLEEGVVIDAEDQTLLFRAAENNNATMLHLLVEQGVRVDNKLLGEMQEVLSLDVEIENYLREHLT